MVQNLYYRKEIDHNLKHASYTCNSSNYAFFMRQYDLDLPINFVNSNPAPEQTYIYVGIMAVCCVVHSKVQLYARVSQVLQTICTVCTRHGQLEKVSLTLNPRIFKIFNLGQKFYHHPTKYFQPHPQPHPDFFCSYKRSYCFSIIYILTKLHTFR